MSQNRMVAPDGGPGENYVFHFLFNSVQKKKILSTYFILLPFFLLQWHRNILNFALKYFFRLINLNSLSIVTEQQKSFKILQLPLLSVELGLNSI